MSGGRSVVNRESLIVRTFIEIADTLVGDFDAIDMLTTLALRSVQLLDVAAAGILLADAEGRQRIVASSSDQVQLLELFQVQNEEGPCMDCYAGGTVIAAPDLSTDTRWPKFAAESLARGFAAVWAVPLRFRADTIGCVNLFGVLPGGLSDEDVSLAQALTDVASIMILQNESTQSAARREEQLQQALNSRVVIEQAKGVIAERAGVGMDEAFTRLRRYARSNSRQLSDVAAGVVAGSVDTDAVARL